MNVNYLDASAWVKRYFEEAGSASVAKIFESTDRIACTRFGLVEVTATIARKGAVERLSPEMVFSLLALADEDFVALDQIQITEELLINAETLATKYRLRAGDAVHLASAMILARRDSVTSVTMISSDSELLNAAADVGIHIFNPSASS